ncbi:MAG: hypothetical protein HKN11_16905 [Rhizobiales bacterium]|nr:hypothetical protein [Hyphomicrobiales bacterium]
MQQHPNVTVVTEIMESFADATGLCSPTSDPRRYLWTDAFAVCNFLELYRETGAPKYLLFATDLVNQVHETLGKHRRDDPRQGWISGLDAIAGKAHPTRAGLRIGKKLSERKPDEPFDEHLEWERDGQYYHYLTKWAHALCQMATVTGDPVYRLWAAELSQTMHRGFVHAERQGKPKRLFWKMSIDLSVPQVPSMGHHDPLDGFVTCHEVARISDNQTDFDLSAEINDLAEMCQHQSWATGDPLGVGGLLFDAHRMLQMAAVGFEVDTDGLIADVLQSAAAGLDFFLAQGGLNDRAEQRLAFRELGLSIGLHGVPGMRAFLEAIADFDGYDVLEAQLTKLMPSVHVAKSIEEFWLNPANRKCASWQGHEDINMVMLATSLAPAGFLDLHLLQRAGWLGAAGQ